MQVLWGQGHAWRSSCVCKNGDETDAQLPVAPLKTQASSVGTTAPHAPRHTAIGVRSVFCGACSANEV